MKIDLESEEARDIETCMRHVVDSAERILHLLAVSERWDPKMRWYTRKCELRGKRFEQLVSAVATAHTWADIAHTLCCRVIDEQQDPLARPVVRG